MVFTGEETGVIKAAEAAMATTIANGIGETCSCSANEMAIGATKIAVAVLEINKLTTAENKQHHQYQVQSPIPYQLQHSLYRQLNPAGLLQRRGKGHHADNQNQARPVNGIIGAFGINTTKIT